MHLSPLLDQYIAQGLSLVERHPHHDLPLWHRRRIWLTFGPPQNIGSRTLLSASYSLSSGTRGRALLAVTTARYALDIWEPYIAHGSQALPQNILSHASALLQGRVSWRDAEQAYDRFRSEVDVIAYVENPPSMINLAIVMSAMRAHRTVLWDELLTELGSTLDTSAITDAELDYDLWDAAAYAMYAFARGWISDPTSDMLQRRKFWEWWLTTGVPQAWHSREQGTESDRFCGNG